MNYQLLYDLEFANHESIRKDLKDSAIAKLNSLHQNLKAIHVHRISLLFNYYYYFFLLTWILVIDFY